MTIKSIIGNIINLGGLFNIIDARSEEDMEVSRKTRKAWQEFDDGLGVQMTEEELRRELDVW